VWVAASVHRSCVYSRLGPAGADVSDTYQRMMTITWPESPSARIETARAGFEEIETYPDDQSALIESPQYGSQYYGVARYGKEMLARTSTTHLI
jgi:hypothetical protein